MQNTVTQTLNNIFTQQGLPFFATKSQVANVLHLDGLRIKEDGQVQTTLINSQHIMLLALAIASGGIGLQYEYKDKSIKSIKPSILTRAFCRVSMYAHATTMVVMHQGLRVSSNVAPYGFMQMKPDNDMPSMITLHSFEAVTLSRRQHIIAQNLRAAFPENKVVL